MNPYLPKLRANAVYAVQQGKPIRAVARNIGVYPSTVLRWLRRAPRQGRVLTLPTRSSRPHHHPWAVDRSVIERIIALRAEQGRCAEILHAQLIREGIVISLSTVKRILAREGLLKKRSPWKHTHQSGERPRPEIPGKLVEMDSIHLWEKRRVSGYIVTLIDVCSRWGYAWALSRLNTLATVGVVRRARIVSPFPFSLVQSDHGPEFSSHFTRRLTVWGIQHRHIRIRKPNDNAHVERFNRTLQEELQTDIIRFSDNPRKLNQALTDWLQYYNKERLHLGLNCKTPYEVLPRY
ncbi:MAG: integrase core domain-containing protein [bacterium]